MSTPTAANMLSGSYTSGEIPSTLKVVPMESRSAVPGIARIIGLSLRFRLGWLTLRGQSARIVIATRCD
jgi:hypothetical protein